MWKVLHEVLTDTEQQVHRTERKRQKPNEARWKREQTKDLLKAAEDARDKNRIARRWGGGERGTYRDTSVCSDRFNVFVLQKFFLLFLQLQRAQ